MRPLQANGELSLRGLHKIREESPDFIPRVKTIL